MFNEKKISSIIRLCAALILSVILLPYILRTYLALAPGADTQSVWIAFIQAAPFGDWIATVVTSVWSEAQSGIDALLGWLTSPEVPFPIHLTIELGKLVFSGVLLIVVTNFIGKKILQGSSDSILDQAANVVFQVLCCFGASLLADIIFRFFESQLAQADSTVAQIGTALFSFFTSGGSILILIVLGVGFLNTILAILTNCLKLLLSYTAFLWLLLNDMQEGPGWLLPVGIVIWLLLLWILQRLEKALLPS